MKALFATHHSEAFKQQLESGPVYFLGRNLTPVGQESPLFQSLAPEAKASAIPVQDFHLGGAAIDEDEQLTTQRL